MKIYIAVDMEGISGISNTEYISTNARLYATGQRLMTEDVNAAVRGAFDAGAKEVIVADVHASSGNILVESLDPRASLLSGVPHKPRFPFLDTSFGGIVLLGYHAMAGTPNACMEHTMTSQSWYRFTSNGTPLGEVGIDAQIAASSGVPVVMVSGDDKMCREARALLGEQIETAQVKIGVGRQCALCLSPEAGRQRIYDAMGNAVRRLLAGENFPLAHIDAPAKVRITYKHVADADAACDKHANRIDGYTVETEYARLCDMYGGIWAEYQ